MGKWLAGYAVTLAPRTQELYGYISRKHIVPALGSLHLGQVKPQHLQSLYADKLSDGLSPRTVQLIHSLAHKSLDNAVKNGLIVRNPADAADPPRVSRHESKVMSESDLALFLAEARKGEYFSLFYLYLFTGMRRGEALALRWSDIDFLGCQLSAHRTLQYLDSAEHGHRVSFKIPKTAKSRRVISLSPSTVTVLRLHREAQDSLRRSLGMAATSQDGLVFCRIDGSPYLPNSVTHAWIKLTRKCGLDGIRLHDARHSHASLMLKGGIHPKVVQERLGHASIAITLDTYSHVAPGMQAAAATRFDDIVIGDGDELGSNSVAGVVQKP